VRKSKNNGREYVQPTNIIAYTLCTRGDDCGNVEGRRRLQWNPNAAIRTRGKGCPDRRNTFDDTVVQDVVRCTRGHEFTQFERQRRTTLVRQTVRGPLNVQAGNSYLTRTLLSRGPRVFVVPASPVSHTRVKPRRTRSPSRQSPNFFPKIVRPLFPSFYTR